MSDKISSLIAHRKITPEHVKSMNPDSLKHITHSGLDSYDGSRTSDYNRSLKNAAIKNPHFSTNHLFHLATDDDDEVATEAIHHPEARVDHLHSYLDYENPDENNRRLEVISHPKVSTNILHSLTHDDDDEVAEKASEALLYHPEAAKHKHTFIDLAYSPFDHVATKAKEVLANKFNHDFDPEND